MPLDQSPIEKKIGENVATIILAGGQGTRLFPLTQTRCKPAVCFGGKYRLIDIPLSHAVNSHIEHIYVISQYFSAFLHEHIKQIYPVNRLSKMKIHLITPQESCNQKRGYKGTADAVRQNLSYLREAPCDYFLILSGDQLYNMDYSQIVKFAKESNADMIVAALPVEEKQAKRMGLLKIDSSLRLFEFYEKPADSCVLNNFLLDASFLQGHTLRNPQANHFLGSMGIYLFKRQVLFKLLEEQGDDFGKDLIPLALKRADSYTYIFKGYWEDIGTIASFYEANLALIKKEYCIDMYDEHYPIFASAHHLPTPFIQDTMIRQAHICQGSIIEAQEIKNSVIGVRTHIKKGTVVHNSVILGNLSYFPYQNSKTSAIGENCLLEKVIIDEDTYIGNNVRLVNKQQLQNYDGDGIYIRDGIIVVTTGSSLPDGFVL